MRMNGQRRLERRVSQALGKLDDATPMFRQLAQSFERSLKSNMTRGVDPDGRKLPPTQAWTRRIRAGIGQGVAGATAPLLATGQLRNSIGATTIGKRSLRFGFHGGQSTKAESMTYGRPGMMRIRQDRIKVSAEGEPYLSFRIGDKWTTFTQGGKFTGSHLRIKPQARRFFFLGREDYRNADKILERFITI